jgi:phosphoribosylglycinamide formyltransferase-1
VVKIAIFASGSGTNAVNIYNYFFNSSSIKVGLIVTDNPLAGIIEKAHQLDIPVEIVNKEIRNSNQLVAIMSSYSIDFIVLAGYLKLINPLLLAAFPNKIVNIHPSLLPKYGGKGMFGMHVHQAVIAHDEPRSGITIHIVNEQYDKGKILVQKAFPLTGINNAESLAKSIHQYEYKYYPATIEAYIKSLFI